MDANESVRMSIQAALVSALYAYHAQLIRDYVESKNAEDQAFLKVEMDRVAAFIDSIEA